MCLAAYTAQCGYSAFEAIGVIIDTDHCRTLAGHDLGGGAANAVGECGDYSDLVLEAHGSPLSAPLFSDRDQHGRVLNATRDSSAACRRAGDAAEDPARGDASRGSRSRRRVGQRAHHRAALELPPLAPVLRAGAEPDLGCRSNRAGEARHQCAGIADAAPAAAREEAGDIAEFLGG